ncbi:hypothetical protein SZ64_07940 [Erythrobacter sp. SG61-1L]|uniref:hypothetical protein n=1 Tax=Erythrobacter sp. SG61-1L TaxID=1603897 RepID=UPI0006C915EA|nr:hypothetical protein [Erythrobacter sp. SG61-1L]KPL68053.1 hypothetical protein SZ64_07940 [Erythrobacter sp. SG61-1L]
MGRKISQLPAAEAATGTESVLVVQGGATKTLPIELMRGPPGGGADGFGDLAGVPGDNVALAAILAALAPKASPAFLGTPTAPTAAPGTNTTQLATTAFVLAATAAILDSAPEALNTLNELAAALGDDPAFATTVLNALATKASLTGAETLTNKRITRRVVAAPAASGNLTANCDTTDRFKAFGLTGATTFPDPTGTPTDQQQLVVYAKDNGTSRAISWGASFVAAKNKTLPVATTAGKWFKAAFEWNSDDAKWVMVALVEQA